jgi:Na+-driven multidrug efflux pump
MPGLVNGAITNMSVVLLTGIAGRLGTEAAIGYAMGARLEYILIPLGFGFGTAIVAMVGTNWGAKQYPRARQIAWTGAATVATTCAVIGLFAALFPEIWFGLFNTDAESNPYRYSVPPDRRADLWILRTWHCAPFCHAGVWKRRTDRSG